MLFASCKYSQRLWALASAVASTVIASCLLFVGCQSQRDLYSIAMKSCDHLQCVIDFRRIYGPDCRVWVMYYDGRYGPPTVCAEVIYNDRYWVNYQHGVQFYNGFTSVKKTGEGRVVVNEVKSVTVQGDDIVETQFADRWTLDEEQWEQVVAADGNLSVTQIPASRSLPPIGGIESLSKRHGRFSSPNY